MNFRTSKPFQKVKTITYKYKNGDIKHIEFKNALTIRESGWELADEELSDITKDYIFKDTGYIDIPENIRRSNMRAIAKIEHYTHENDFEYFITLTYNPEYANNIKLDIKSIEDTMKHLSTWLTLQRKKYNKFYYIFVPERHIKGAIHWHGVIKGYQGDLKHFGLYKGRDTFTLSEWSKNGFSTATKINNLAKTSNYLSKYIVKSIDLDMIGKRRYLVSKGLDLPLVVYNEEIDTNDMLEYDNNHCNIYYTKEFDIN